MTYNYKQITLELEDNEVYLLCDLLEFAMEYHAITLHPEYMSEEEIRFARRLIDILKEDK